jgi:hypothetical protein
MSHGLNALVSEDSSFVRNPGRVWPITAPVKCYGFPDEVVNYYQNADVVKALAFSFEKLFQGFFYLGPLRDKLMRQYTWRADFRNRSRNLPFLVFNPRAIAVSGDGHLIQGRNITDFRLRTRQHERFLEPPFLIRAALTRSPGK